MPEFPLDATWNGEKRCSSNGLWPFDFRFSILNFQSPIVTPARKISRS